MAITSVCRVSELMALPCRSLYLVLHKDKCTHLSLHVLPSLRRWWLFFFNLCILRRLRCIFCCALGNSGMSGCYSLLLEFGFFLCGHKQAGKRAWWPPLLPSLGGSGSWWSRFTTLRVEFLPYQLQHILPKRLVPPGCANIRHQCLKRLPGRLCIPLLSL